MLPKMVQQEVCSTPMPTDILFVTIHFDSTYQVVLLSYMRNSWCYVGKHFLNGNPLVNSSLAKNDLTPVYLFRSIYVWSL